MWLEQGKWGGCEWVGSGESGDGGGHFACDFILLLLSCSVVSCSLPPHGLQHTRLPCAPLSPRVCSDSCPLSQWCHPTTSSSASALFSCFHLSQHQGLFQWAGSLHQVAKVLELQLQSFYWIFRVDFLYDWLVWSPLSKGLSRVFSSTTIWKYQFVGAQPSLWFNSHISTWLKNHNFDYTELWIWKMALIRLGSHQRVSSGGGADVQSVLYIQTFKLWAFRDANVHLVPTRSQNLCHQHQASVKLQPPSISYWRWSFSSPISHLLQSVTLLACSLNACWTVRLYFSRYCTIRFKIFSLPFVFVFMYLCEMCYKSMTAQYYVASCVSWVPRLTLLDVGTNWTCKCAFGMDRICMQNT